MTDVEALAAEFIKTKKQHADLLDGDEDSIRSRAVVLQKLHTMFGGKVSSSVDRLDVTLDGVAFEFEVGCGGEIWSRREDHAARVKVKGRDCKPADYSADETRSYPKLAGGGFSWQKMQDFVRLCLQQHAAIKQRRKENGEYKKRCQAAKRAAAEWLTSQGVPHHGYEPGEALGELPCGAKLERVNLSGGTTITAQVSLSGSPEQLHAALLLLGWAPSLKPRPDE